MPRTRYSVQPYQYSETPNLDTPFQVDSASFSTSLLDFPHALFAPLHYAPGYAYPLIVWLHGSGSDERQLQRIMPLVSMQNYVAVAPRGLPLTGISLTAAGAPAAAEGYGWPSGADIPVCPGQAGMTAPPIKMADRSERAEQRVFESIELAQRKFHVDPRRVFLAGFDGGGTMALRLAMTNPRRVAGVISLCGPLPTGGTPLGNLIAARRLGMFLATGRGSSDYPADQVCEDLRLLHTAGLSVTLRQYPCGHELLPQMLADINRWIMEQINPSSTSAVESGAEWSHETE